MFFVLKFSDVRAQVIRRFIHALFNLILDAKPIAIRRYSVFTFYTSPLSFSSWPFLLVIFYLLNIYGTWHANVIEYKQFSSLLKLAKGSYRGKKVTTLLCTKQS